MKKMLGLMIYGGILFGLSAGGAWYMKTQHEQALAEQRDQLADPNAGLVPSSTAGPTVTNPNPNDMPDVDGTSRRVPVRAGEMTVEEIVQYGMGLKERDDAIHQREKAIQRVEAQYRLVQDDIKAEQMAIEGILEQARTQKLAADEILRQAAAREEKIEALKEEVEKERRDVAMERTKAEKLKAASPSVAADEDADRAANIKGITAVLEGMSEDGGARIIGDLMDEGKTEFAVRLLSGLEDRKSAKVLEALAAQEGGEDKATELINRYAEMKRPRRSAKR